MMTLVVATAVGIYLLRASFVVSAGRLALPASCERILGQARPAVLGALVASSLAGGGPTAAPDPATWVVAGVAFVVSARLSMSRTVAVGLVTIALLGFVGV